MIRRPPRSTLDRSSAASDVYKRQVLHRRVLCHPKAGRVEDRGAVRGNRDRALDPDQGQPCLLYTSPSPRDRTRSRMPSSA